MSADKGKGGSVLHGIALSKKGKLLWTESFQLLQTFVEEVLNLSNGVWSCPGRDAKQYKNEDLDLRWYLDTQTITLNGKAKGEIKEKLLSIVAIQGQLANSVNKEFDLNDEVDETTTSTSQQNNNNLSLETLDSQLKAISKVVNANTAAVKLFTDNANVHHTEMDNLKMENLKLRNESLDLKSENDNLKERVNNLSYILADLQGKTKNAEDAKDSLIIALRLLIEDLNHKGGVSNVHRSEDIELKSPQAGFYTQQSKEVPNEVINQSINLSNRFSALSVDENDVNDRNARAVVRNDIDCAQETTPRSTQTHHREKNQPKRNNKTTATKKLLLPNVPSLKQNNNLPTEIAPT